MKRGIELAGEFMAAILDNPALLERVPDGATITLVPDDDPDLAEANISAGLDAVRRGEPRDAAADNGDATASARN